MYFSGTDALNGALGGLLIGLSAALFLLLTGRIAGISGLAAALVSAGPTGRRVEAALFIAGLVAAPLVYVGFRGPVEIGLTDAPVLLIIGGLLVGVGTRIGNGCTSGHGVCGMSRFSIRSIVATGVFMAVAVAMATLVRPMMASVLGG
jgi:uncharacterized membrane protein YedE/YeeE